MKPVMWIPIGLAAAILAALSIHDSLYPPNLAEESAKSADRDMIARCAKARDDELSDLDTRRFMRESCQQMEKDFEAKWGVPSWEL